MAPTLIPPPPNSEKKAPIENVLQLTSLTAISPDLFTNTRPLWRPPGARGIFGGAAIAQALAAAQLTVPPPSPANNHAKFYVHSMHCYFVLAGDADIPLIYAVERVRDGKSFLTRTVQVRQRGRCIFTTTLSFVREGSAGAQTIDHAAELPPNARAELERVLEATGEKGATTTTAAAAAAAASVSEVVRRAAENGDEMAGPFDIRRIPYVSDESARPDRKRVHAWLRARGTISPNAGHEPHLNALAYMSDSWFIGTVARVNNLWRFASPEKQAKTAAVPVHERESSDLELAENARKKGPARKIGMMVSLDHAIYFHRPMDIKADDWMFQEMESPWSGDGRGLVVQRIWNKEGVLLATCVQEGVVRLRQESERKEKL